MKVYSNILPKVSVPITTVRYMKANVIVLEVDRGWVFELTPATVRVEGRGFSRRVHGFNQTFIINGRAGGMTCCDNGKAVIFQIIESELVAGGTLTLASSDLTDGVRGHVSQYNIRDVSIK